MKKRYIARNGYFLESVPHESSVQHVFSEESYKKRIREMFQDPASSAGEDSAKREVYRRGQSAHKWLLVTCFGYLGHKNARSGGIEAHESVTAYGRECLLRAQEIAERRAFRVLHANVDSLWVQKQGTKEGCPERSRREDYDALMDEITRVTSIPIALEGIYRWVAVPAVPPGRADDGGEPLRRRFRRWRNQNAWD